MRILVFGAGVLGCNLARDLFRAGKDVTLLARGTWGEEIRQNGLRIKDKFSPRMSVSRIPVVTELRPEDRYDVIFVVTRCTQLDSVRETLLANPTENLVFVGNDVRADALAASLPGKNVLFAFVSAAGHRERDHVASIDLRKITIGQLAGAPSNEALIGQIFEGTKYKVAYEPNMGDYLLPKEDTDFEGAAYRRTCLRFFRLMCATSLGKICASDHAMNAVDEMSALNRDLKRFFDENGASYHTWQSLEKDAEKYLR